MHFGDQGLRGTWWFWAEALGSGHRGKKGEGEVVLMERNKLSARSPIVRELGAENTKYSNSS